jgi:hypothetical protein
MPQGTYSIQTARRLTVPDFRHCMGCGISGRHAAKGRR